MAKPSKPEVEAPKAPQEVSKAFSVRRREGWWVMITYTLKDGQITATDETQPDLRVLALEAFKIAAYKYWISQ